MTVVVAARDEEASLGECLESLRNQNYPPGKWNAVVVDDRSCDGTEAMIQKAREKCSAIHGVRVTDCPPTLGGKQNALAVGIVRTEKAGLLGELILLTDADCILPPSWIGDVVDEFGPGVGLVAGRTVLRAISGFVALIEQLDLEYLLNVATGMIALGQPVSAIGNNLAIRSEVYREIGGFWALGYTVTEDCALVQKVAASGWRVANASAASPVLTRQSDSVRSLIRQRVRWAAGIRHVRGWAVGLPILALVYRLWIVFLTGTAVFGFLDWRLPASMWVSSFIADAILLSANRPCWRTRRWAAASPLLTIWQVLYQPIVAVGAILGRTTLWRGSKYRV